MNTFKYVGLTGMLLLSGTAQSLDLSDWEVRPRVATGMMQYEYNQTPQVLILRDESFVEGVGQEGLKAEDSLLFAELGVSVFLGNFFVDLSFQKSDEGQDSVSFDSVDAFVLDPTTLNPATTFTATDQSGKIDIDRQELSLSVGYVLTDNLGLFAGYKRNETNLDQNFAGQVFVAQDGVATEFDILVNANSEFEQDGFFLGATYVWPFESDGWLNGALSFDLGVAFLDGDFTTKGTKTLTAELIDQSTTVDAGGNASGSAVGFNLGVAWSGPLVNNLNYSVGIDGYQYDYDGDGKSADFEDTLVRFSVGLSYALGAN